MIACTSSLFMPDYIRYQRSLFLAIGPFHVGDQHQYEIGYRQHKR